MTTRTAWTPGPWHHDCRSDRDEQLVRTPSLKGTIATVGAYAGMKYPEQAANAQLIALAPEMVEALRYLVSYAESMERHLNIDGSRNSSLSAARAILSRLPKGE